MTNLAYNIELKPSSYLKQIIKINLKSLKVNSLNHDIEIWSIGNEDITASSESGFYDTYTIPESELRSNPAKFKKILSVSPGETKTMEIATPVKKILMIVH